MILTEQIIADAAAEVNEAMLAGLRSREHAT